MLNRTPLPKKNILFVTGTRADYGKLEPLAIEAADAGFPVTFFVTGMHMMEKYGLTKTEIHRNSDRFNIVEYINQRDGDPQDIIVAKTIIGFSDFLKEMRPDLVVIHGDRVEALACALVSAMNYILCAHIEGGRGLGDHRRGFPALQHQALVHPSRIVENGARTRPASRRAGRFRRDYRLAGTGHPWQARPAFRWLRFWTATRSPRTITGSAFSIR